MLSRLFQRGILSPKADEPRKHADPGMQYSHAFAAGTVWEDMASSATAAKAWHTASHGFRWVGLLALPIYSFTLPETQTAHSPASPRRGGTPSRMPGAGRIAHCTGRTPRRGPS